MKQLRKGHWLVALVVLAGVGCEDVGFEGGLPLRVTVTADKTREVVGQEIQFQYEAEGTNLFQVALSFGDGKGDSISGVDAKRVVRRIGHAYQAAGSYPVTARAHEASGRSATHEITVEIVTTR